MKNNPNEISLPLDSPSTNQQNNNNQHNKYKSYQKIQFPNKPKSKYSQRISNPAPMISNEMMKQLEAEYQNVSNYKITNRQHYQPHHPQTNYLENKTYKFNKIQLVNSQQHPKVTKRVEQVENGKLSYQPKVVKQDFYKIYEPDLFQSIKQTKTVQDEEQSPVSYYQSNKNYKQIHADNFKKQKRSPQYRVLPQSNNDRARSHKDKKQPFKQFKQQSYFPVQAYPHIPHQQRARKYTHPHVENFINTPQSNGQNHNNNQNSRKSESVHPIFRDTLQYVDALKYNLSSRITQYSSPSHRQQSQQSQDSQQGQNKTNTNQKNSFHHKYKKYKHKYIKVMQAIKQLQNLNYTLIKDQRENYNYYEGTIKNLQNLLTIKDQEIQQLNEVIIAYEAQEMNSNMTSMQGRQYEVDNSKLKKQLETKTKEIKELKKNITNIDTSFQVAEKQESIKNKSLEKKINLLEREKQSLMRKSKALEELNQMFEQKMKDKQTRIGKLSSFNSELQEELIKLKDKSRIQETNDTQQTTMSFMKKSNLREAKQIQKKQKGTINNSSLQKNLESIDEQIKLIKLKLIKKGENKVTNSKSQSKIPATYIQQLELQDEEQQKKSQVQEKQQKKYIDELKKMIQKLTNFSEELQE